MRFGNIIALLLFTFFFAPKDVAANGESNKKVSVIEVAFDSAVEDMQWMDRDHSVVLARTKGGRLYRSMDSGRVWSDVTSHLESDQSHNQAEVFVHNLIMNPIDKHVAVVVTSGHEHFVTQDGGRTFSPIDHHGSIHNVIFHKTHPHWMLLSMWTSACVKLTERDQCNHELYMTKNLGRSVHLVANYVVQFGWGDSENREHHMERIFLTHYKTKHGEQLRHGKWLKTVDFAYTDDFGKSFTAAVPGGNKFLMSGGYTFVAAAKDHTEQTVELHVSIDGGDTFNIAKLPVELHEKSYTILDTSENSVMLHVNHGPAGRSTTGNVYVSDASGLRYSLSLAHNVRTASGECEFDKVHSLDGAYIANYKDTEYEEAALKDDVGMFDLLADDELDEISIGSESDEKQHTGHRHNNEYIRTVMSFNKGGSWNFLTPPRVDSVGNPIRCNERECYLHLHGVTNYDKFAPFYSLENAVGLIIGTGNIGSHLKFDAALTNTYISRDGGLTWLEAHKGPYIYEMGDHGGLIVMADDLYATDKVVFSWNEGQSWYDFDLGKDLVNVENIVIEPNSSSVDFILYGTKESGGGAVYHLDFNALEQPACRGLWASDTPTSDYETWSPSDVHEKQCLLGRHVTYTRRKRSSECFNGKEFKPKINKFHCECTPDDYECEFGFSRRVGGTECRASDQTLEAPHCTSSSYFYANAYRRVPGNSCKDGWVPEKVAVPCPPHSPFSRGARLVLWSLVIVGCAVACITFVSRSPKYRTLLRNYGFETFSNVRYSMLNPKNDVVFNAGQSTGKYAPDLGFPESDDEYQRDDDTPPHFD
eukprot:GHVO01028384.1.p1 GENE.GHVO01028384.1~~GHVO01028384.1.p1  ORF type:complete len:816 (-),score=140.45 GHVO01028384.1:141-2588(-)